MTDALSHMANFLIGFALMVGTMVLATAALALLLAAILLMKRILR